MAIIESKNIFKNAWVFLTGGLKEFTVGGESRVGTGQILLSIALLALGIGLLASPVGGVGLSTVGMLVIAGGLISGVSGGFNFLDRDVQNKANKKRKDKVEGGITAILESKEMIDKMKIGKEEVDGLINDKSIELSEDKEAFLKVLLKKSGSLIPYKFQSNYLIVNIWYDPKDYCNDNGTFNEAQLLEDAVEHSKKYIEKFGGLLKKGALSQFKKGLSASAEELIKEVKARIVFVRAAKKLSSPNAEEKSLSDAAQSQESPSVLSQSQIMINSQKQGHPEVIEGNTDPSKVREKRGQTLGN